MTHELENLRERAFDYEANDETKQKLSRYVLSMLIAPRAVGKSTLADAAIDSVKQYDIWGIAPTMTTRDRRYGIFGDADPAAPAFQTADEGISHGNLMRKINAGEVVNYSVHPNGTIYATYANGFENEFNLLPTLPSSVPAIKRAGFERTESIFITANVVDWNRWLDKRNASDWQEEAIENLEFAEAHANELHFVHNSGLNGGKEKAVSEIIDITLGFPHSEDRETNLHIVGAMLKYAKHHAVKKD